MQVRVMLASTCPRCGVELSALSLEDVGVESCAQCGGTWASIEALQAMVERADVQAVLAQEPAVARSGVPEVVKYVPCPVCKQMMNRVNFASISGVILESCKKHGVFFDRGELKRLGDFLLAGGLEKARAKSNAKAREAERERDVLHRQRVALAERPTHDSGHFLHNHSELRNVSIASEVVGAVFEVLLWL